MRSFDTNISFLTLRILFLPPNVTLHRMITGLGLITSPLYVVAKCSYIMKYSNIILVLLADQKPLNGQALYHGKI